MRRNGEYLLRFSDLTMKFYKQVSKLNCASKIFYFYYGVKKNLIMTNVGLSTQCSLCTQQIVGITCDVPCVMEDHLLPVIGWALSQIKNVFPSHQFQNCDHVF